MENLRFKRFMERKNVTIAELSERARVSRATISYILNGRIEPSVRTVRRLAKGFKCTYDEVYVAIYGQDDFSFEGIPNREPATVGMR